MYREIIQAFISHLAEDLIPKSSQHQEYWYLEFQELNSPPWWWWWCLAVRTEKHGNVFVQTNLLAFLRIIHLWFHFWRGSLNLPTMSSFKSVYDWLRFLWNLLPFTGKLVEIPLVLSFFINLLLLQHTPPRPFSVHPSRQCQPFPSTVRRFGSNPQWNGRTKTSCFSLSEADLRAAEPLGAWATDRF